MREKIFTEYLYVRDITIFLDDVSITLIDKTDGSNPTKRETETFWRDTLKTLARYALNVENGI